MITETREISYRARKRSFIAALKTGWWSILCLLLAGNSIVLSAQDEQPSTDSVKFTTLINFDLTNGAIPLAALVQGTDGNLYGTTSVGGTNCAYVGGCGTFFKVSPSGTLTSLYDFCPEGPPCADTGQVPASNLVLGTDGSFYGIAFAGGSGAYCPLGANACGTVFKVTPGGALTTIYNWCSQPNCTDGSLYLYPIQKAFVQAPDGNFYGTAQAGGAFGNGTVFKLTPGGTLTTLYTFCSQTNCLDGALPWGLIQGTDGNFYGTTLGGGANGSGTVFKITSRGSFTTLYAFCSQGGSSCTDGGQPYGPLIQGLDGAFYGTTAYRGNGAACQPFAFCGTAFKMTSAGSLTTLYSFCSQTNCEDGSWPVGALAQGTDGKFYGTTSTGGANANGTVFEVSSQGVLTTLQSLDTTIAGSATGVVQATNGNFYGTNVEGGTSSACGSLGFNGCGTVFSLSVGLGPFVENVPSSGKIGTLVKILGTNLTGATGVSFNGVAAVYKVVSKTLISATVPAGATTGFVSVTTPSGTLKSNMRFQVTPYRSILHLR